MNRIVNTNARAYRSQLRTEQADDTRARILDATVRVMADGIATVSVPGVARAAGVSVPTVYRHFGTKQDLLAAVYPHLEHRAGRSALVMPTSIDHLRDGVRTLLDHLDAFDDLARAAMASPAAGEARALSMPRRLAMTRRMTESIEAPLSDGERERLARLLVILTSSASLLTWRDLLGVSADDAADDIDWVVRSAIAGAATIPGPPSRDYA
jgi:AcrR family transcriptional regulator